MLSKLTTWLLTAFKTFVTSPLTLLTKWVTSIGTVISSYTSLVVNYITAFFSWISQSLITIVGIVMTGIMATYHWLKGVLTAGLPQLLFGTDVSDGSMTTVFADYFVDTSVLIDFATEAISWLVLYYAVIVSGLGVWVTTRVIKLIRG